ncbi:class I SAM-dependent methyltransferase [Sphingomonas sp. LaA6.9]|uniref:class I SAM-dependent methyltransferase n=1 Tax=Sphingomonas sp. LaA6.9 TaxID=2919914 RepID=UPI001F4F27FC|nr:class I SAM-dependent methyltransferase [Sphingomonas sp. LaA6.9]MCJ8157433.1 class I SAM-dependent methyltransferase [Sphingomonas sp. LaA6.9]
MDAIYRHQRHIYDLTRKYYLLGRDRLIAGLNVPVGGTVLEIGCGTGRNLIAAARSWPHAQCFGFDISSAMLETAGASVARRGLAGRIALTQGDATAFDAQGLFGRASFDRIFLSYTLSMIPGWQATIAASCDALADKGALHIVDFGQQERLPRIFRALLFAWLARFDVTPRADLKQVLVDIAEARGLVVDFVPLWRGYAWSAVLRKPARAA